MNSALLSDPWWTATDAATWAGAGGAGLGIVAGLVGSLLGTLAVRGRGRAILVPAHALLVLLGLVGMLIGVVAIALAQPFHVFFVLLLPGALLTLTLGSMLPLTLLMYRVADARRAAEVPEVSANAIAATNATNTAVAKVLMSLWGPGGAHAERARSLRAAALILAGVCAAATLACIALLGPDARAPAWGAIALAGWALLAAAITTFWLWGTARVLTPIRDLIERQRFEGEQLRRG